MTQTAKERLEQINDELAKETAEYVALLRLRAWQLGRLSYKLHDAQMIIYKTLRGLPPGVKEAVCLCARRFGKSYLGVLMAIEDCLRNPGVYVRILGPEISQTVNIVEPLIDKICRDAPPGLVKRKAAEHRWKVGSSWLVLGGFDNTNIKKHLGQEAYAFYIEETGSSNADDYTYAQREVLAPQLLHSRGKRVHLTTPPTDPNHPFVLEVMPKAQVNNVYFKYTIYDNPLLDDEQVKEAIDESGGLDTDAFKRNYLCEIIRDKRLMVIPEFDRKVHVKNFDPPAHAQWMTTIDFGGVRDKTVALLMYYDFKANVDVVWDERVFDENTSTSTIVAGVLEMENSLTHPHKVNYRYGDASGQTHVDANQTHNFHFSMPHKQDLDAAVNAVRVGFKQGKILLHERCKFLALTLESGMFNDKRTDFLRTDALGHFDAGMALVYGRRMLDRHTNPYPDRVFNLSTQIPTHLAVKRDELSEISKSIVPKRFGKK